MNLNLNETTTKIRLKKLIFFAVITTFSAISVAQTQPRANTPTEVNKGAVTEKPGTAFTKFLNDPNFCSMFLGTSDHEGIELNYSKSLNAIFIEMGNSDGLDAQSNIEKSFAKIDSACKKNGKNG